ncbi:restriction endonuclease subunit S [Streptococcus oralis]|uniref:restriction endonuclease subunit S n=1 Tax=Streptococcus oralis TaxID=1303 RepID=UPI0020007CFF|nr:restriction endonuclease subunit S [Streptococcus oralis]
MKLIDVCKPKQWKTISTNELVKDGYPVFGANGIIGYFSDYNHEKPTLCITCRGATCGTVNKSLPYSYVTGNSMALDDLDESVIMIDFLYYFLQYRGFNDVITGSAQPQITRQSLSKIIIPDFDITIQKEITQTIHDLEHLILIRNKQIENLTDLVKSRFNEMFGDVILNDKEWKFSKWNEILTIRNGKNQKNVEDKNGQFPIYGSGGIIGYAKDWIVKKNSVIIGRKGNINKPILVRENFWNVDTAFGLEPTLDKINSEYLFYFCQLYNFEKLNKAVTIPSLTKSDLLDISIPLPPLSLQNEFADFVAQVDKSQLAIQKSLEELETLKKSLMQEYFG